MSKKMLPESFGQVCRLEKPVAFMILCYTLVMKHSTLLKDLTSLIATEIKRIWALRSLSQLQQSVTLVLVRYH